MTNSTLTLEMLITFFSWNTFIHIAIMSLWLCLMKFAPEFFRAQQNIWFPISKENFVSINYQLYGIYKLAFLILIVVPFIVLLIMK